MMFKKSTFIVLLLAAISIGWAAHATLFPVVYKENGIELPLRAAAQKRVFLVRSLAAGVYLAESDGKTAEDFLKDVPKRIEMTFFVHIDQEDFVGYVRGKIWDNVSKKEFEAMEEQLTRMAQYIFETNPYDRYAVTYIPGVGTHFEYNGKLMGTIEGENFAKGLFSVWMGKHPMDRWLKKHLVEEFGQDTKKSQAKDRQVSE